MLTSLLLSICIKTVDAFESAVMSMTGPKRSEISVPIIANGHNSEALGYVQTHERNHLTGCRREVRAVRSTSFYKTLKNCVTYL